MTEWVFPRKFRGWGPNSLRKETILTCLFLSLCYFASRFGICSKSTESWQERKSVPKDNANDRRGEDVVTSYRKGRSSIKCTTQQRLFLRSLGCGKGCLCALSTTQARWKNMENNAPSNAYLRHVCCVRRPQSWDSHWYALSQPSNSARKHQLKFFFVTERETYEITFANPHSILSHAPSSTKIYMHCDYRSSTATMTSG